MRGRCNESHMIPETRHRRDLEAPTCSAGHGSAYPQDSPSCLPLSVPSLQSLCHLMSVMLFTSEGHTCIHTCIYIHVQMYMHVHVHVLLVEVTKQQTCMKGACCTNNHGQLQFIHVHVGCLVTSTKVVVTQRQDSIRPCRAHAVLSLRYNYYLSIHVDPYCRNTMQTHGMYV